MPVEKRRAHAVLQRADLAVPDGAHGVGVHARVAGVVVQRGDREHGPRDPGEFGAQVLAVELDGVADGDVRGGFVGHLDEFGGAVLIGDHRADLGRLLRNADVAAGEAVARKCVSCHVFEEGGANMTGPVMWDVVGRMAGSVDGFNYSNAMQEYDQPWLFENLNAYLENPRGYMPGTAMSFAGLRREDERINMIAYLQSLSNDPVPFPEPLPEDAPEDAGGDESDAAEDAEMAPEMVTPSEDEASGDTDPAE